MGYYWDKLMSEVGPTALALSLGALWILWLLSHRNHRKAPEDTQGQNTSDHESQKQRYERARAQVKERLMSGGLALLESPQLYDKSQNGVESLEIDFVTVFAQGLWLLRVYPMEGVIDGKEADQHWFIQRTMHEGQVIDQEATKIPNPILEDLRFVDIVKKLAQSKKLTEVQIYYALIYLEGEFKVRSSDRVKIMSVTQLNKKVKQYAKTAHQPSVSSLLDEARELWHLIKLRNLKGVD